MAGSDGHAQPRIVGYQRWSNLAFLHWRVDPDRLQSLIPPELTIETYDGAAWLAFVPFSMERIRPWWGIPVPGISWFAETNVRTYVRHENGQTGVWFFSLEANQRLAVWIARTFWHLNYQSAVIKFQCDGKRMLASGHRRQTPESAYELDLSIHSTNPPVTADSDSLEHFLLERYHLFAQHPDGRYLCGRVHHEPYTFQTAEISTLSNSLFDACDCPVIGPPDHIVYSPGVDVSVSPLQYI